MATYKDFDLLLEHIREAKDTIITIISEPENLAWPLYQDPLVNKVLNHLDDIATHLEHPHS